VPSAGFDLWALALVLLEAAGGRAVRASLEPRLRGVLERALSTAPRDRFHTAAELLAALEAARSQD
jgi:hypothetical protein